MFILWKYSRFTNWHSLDSESACKTGRENAKNIEYHKKVQKRFLWLLATYLKINHFINYNALFAKYLHYNPIYNWAYMSGKLSTYCVRAMLRVAALYRAMLLIWWDLVTLTKVELRNYFKIDIWDGHWNSWECIFLNRWWAAMEKNWLHIAKKIN